MTIASVNYVPGISSMPTSISALGRWITEPYIAWQSGSLGVLRLCWRGLSQDPAAKRSKHLLKVYLSSNHSEVQRPGFSANGYGEKAITGLECQPHQTLSLALLGKDSALSEVARPVTKRKIPRETPHGC
jgi:hypothetical protein